MNIDSLGEKGRQMYCTDLATGTALKAALAAGQSIKLTRVVSKRYLNPNADKISWFSSWGPVSTLTLNFSVLPKCRISAHTTARINLL